MKKILMVLAAGTALVTATSASAQYSGQYGGFRQSNDWNMRSGGYSRFDQQYRHTVQGIQHGMNDGTYSRSRANEFFRELQNIRRDAYRAHQYGNYRDDFVQARMARLHERMHLKHDRNHARQDGYGQYDGYYAGNQPRYEEPRHGHDGHDDDDD